jgi:hypothetical protein
VTFAELLLGWKQEGAETTFTTKWSNAWQRAREEGKGGEERRKDSSKSR